MGLLGVGNPGALVSQGDLIARWRGAGGFETADFTSSPAVRPFVHCGRPGYTVPAICSTKRCRCWVWHTAWCYQKIQARGVGVVLWMLLQFLLSSITSEGRKYGRGRPKARRTAVRSADNGCQ